MVAPETTSLPESIITTWSHTCCTSSSRCVAISTEMPNFAGDEQQHLFSVLPERVEAGGRFVEQHQIGIADQRLGKFRTLSIPVENLLDRTEPSPVEPDKIENVGRAGSCPGGQSTEPPNVDTTSAAV